jgi:predicted Zn-dependent protease
MHYRQSRFDQALAKFDRLIENNPNSPFFLEMKAQTLRDKGDLAQSEKYYRQALNKFNKNAPLIEIALAHVLIEQQKYGAEAEKLLVSAIQSDPQETRPYRLLATLKGRQNKQADAQYLLAEEAIRLGRKQEAIRLVSLARQSGQLSENYKIKANDLKIYLNGLPNRN